MYPLLTPPLGLLSLAGYIRTKFNVETIILNQRLYNTATETIVRQIKSFCPDVLGLSTLTSSAYLLYEMVRQLKYALPDALIVIGGPHVSSSREQVLEECNANAAVAGEGELSFEKVLEAWQAGEKEYGGIPGLIWRDPEGKVIVNPGDAEQVTNLDILPPLAYDLVDMKPYWRRQSIAPIRYRRYISLMSSRGCPYQCFWCHNNFGKQIRMHTAERVVDDIERFQKQFGVRDFEFFDDNFNFDSKRVIDICEEIRHRHLETKLVFPTGVRGDLMTENVVDALVSAGMYMCCFALDTGSPRLQKYTGKNMNIDLFLKGLHATRKHHVFVPGFFMMGFPTETEKELQMTADLACQNDFSTAAFYTVTPFPGTVLYNQIMKTHPEKIAALKYDDMELNGVRINLTDLPDDVLFSYQRNALRRFFMDKGRLYRLLRDHPKPMTLPFYVPIFLYRATKGGLLGNCNTGS